MKTIPLLFALICFISMSTNVHAAGCNSIENVWDGDSNGSIRLTYNENDRLELIYREDEGVIVARGLIDAGHERREVYAMYDLKSRNLVYAKSKYTPVAEQLKYLIPHKYYIQSMHDYQVFTANKDFDAEIQALFSESRELGCIEEVKKQWQGRTFDVDKCEQNRSALRKVTAMLAQPDNATFKALTDNIQAQRFIDKFRKRDCDSVQDVGMKIVTEFRKPETLKKLANKKKMPAYLEEDKGIVEVETVERRYY